MRNHGLLKLPLKNTPLHHVEKSKSENSVTPLMKEHMSVNVRQLQDEARLIEAVLSRERKTFAFRARVFRQMLNIPFAQSIP